MLNYPWKSYIWSSNLCRKYNFLNMSLNTPTTGYVIGLTLFDNLSNYLAWTTCVHIKKNEKILLFNFLHAILRYYIYLIFHSIIFIRYCPLIFNLFHLFCCIDMFYEYLIRQQTFYWWTWPVQMVFGIR